MLAIQKFLKFSPVTAKSKANLLFQNDFEDSVPEIVLAIKGEKHFQKYLIYNFVYTGVGLKLSRFANDPLIRNSFKSNCYAQLSDSLMGESSAHSSAEFSAESSAKSSAESFAESSAESSVEYSTESSVSLLTNLLLNVC